MMMDELEEAKKLTDTDAGIMDNYEYLYNNIRIFIWEVVAKSIIYCDFLHIAFEPIIPPPSYSWKIINKKYMFLSVSTPCRGYNPILTLVGFS